MKSSFDILSALYRVINPAVIDEITGKVYITHEANDKLENVVINAITNPNLKVQQPILNININLEGDDEHRADLARTKTILELIKPLVDNVSYRIDGEDYHFEIADDKGTFKDIDIPGKFFYNLRVNCLTV